MREKCLTVGRRETAQMASCCQASCSCARNREQWHTGTLGCGHTGTQPSHAAQPDQHPGIPASAPILACGQPCRALGWSKSCAEPSRTEAGCEQHLTKSLAPDLLTTLAWAGSKRSRDAAEQGVCGECCQSGIWCFYGRRESVGIVAKDGALGMAQLS